MAALSVQYFGGGNEGGYAVARAPGMERSLQRRVGCDAAGDDDGVVALAFERGLQARHQYVDDRGLKRGGDVGAICVAAGLRFEIVANRRLQAGEGEIERTIRGTVARKRVRPRIAVCARRVECGAAGIGQAEQSRGLVVRFAGGVVVRSAENAQLARPSRPRRAASVRRRRATRETDTAALVRRSRNGAKRCPCRWFTA